MPDTGKADVARTHWPDRRALDLLGIDVPIIQAPMAGITAPPMILGVARAGGLGSLPLGMATPDDAQAALDALGDMAGAPVNLNFFCHKPEPDDPVREREWRQRLEPYFEQMGLPRPTPRTERHDSSFGRWQCELVERVRPKVVSFHFGLPDQSLMKRVRATGTKILSSATTVREARWLEAEGCDAIIAQGIEAGGHRGSFLDMDMATQLGTLALVPQLVDAVRVPVIAAGGIGDARGIAAALTLGAAAVQLGTAYLFCPEARISPTFRAALDSVDDEGTVITNILSGRPARALRNRLVRALGPLSDDVPHFPAPAFMLQPLSQASEREGRSDFLAVWCGQGAPLCSHQPSAVLTRRLADEAQALIAAAEV
jgi:nitronate monooxygenase